jgi:hypothetical protein
MAKPRRICAQKVDEKVDRCPSDLEHCLPSLSRAEWASNRELALLKIMFFVAERWEQHQGTNPVRLGKFLPENNLQFSTLSENEKQRLLLASPSYLRELILFAINTGLFSICSGRRWTSNNIA